MKTPGQGLRADGVHGSRRRFNQPDVRPPRYRDPATARTVLIAAFTAPRVRVKT
jgi:hypothetical protein